MNPGVFKNMNRTIPDRERILSALRSADSDIRRLGVKRLALFGSVARGDSHVGSDVDLLVEFKVGEKTYDRFIALSELLESLVGHRVELVTTESLSPFIGPHILAEATDVLRAA